MGMIRSSLVDSYPSEDRLSSRLGRPKGETLTSVHIASAR